MVIAKNADVMESGPFQLNSNNAIITHGLLRITEKNDPCNDFSNATIFLIVCRIRQNASLFKKAYPCIGLRDQVKWAPVGQAGKSALHF